MFNLKLRKSKSYSFSIMEFVSVLEFTKNTFQTLIQTQSYPLSTKQRMR